MQTSRSARPTCLLSSGFSLSRPYIQLCCIRPSFFRALKMVSGFSSILFEITSAFPASGDHKPTPYDWEMRFVCMDFPMTLYTCLFTSSPMFMIFPFVLLFPHLPPPTYQFVCRRFFSDAIERTLPPPKVPILNNPIVPGFRVFLTPRTHSTCEQKTMACESVLRIWKLRSRQRRPFERCDRITK